MEKLIKTNEEWKKILTPLQFKILRERGTERAFSSPYYLNKEKGKYHCVACNNLLFLSEDKYLSGTGWPSFKKAVNGNVIYDDSDEALKVGSEAICSRCGGHLGHVFNDGPEPTKLRFCIDGAILKFKK